MKISIVQNRLLTLGFASLSLGLVANHAFADHYCICENTLNKHGDGYRNPAIYSEYDLIWVQTDPLGKVVAERTLKPFKSKKDLFSRIFKTSAKKQCWRALAIHPSCSSG